MTISAVDWSEYVNKLARVNTKAAELMQKWIDANGTDNIAALFEYAYALSTKYGEAAASLACEMYDSIAVAQGVSLPPALPADTAKIGEVKHLVGKALQKSPNLVSPEVGKMVKQAGADTMLHNAARDGAEWAWVPHGGETCAFCITLASKGWQTAGKSLLYNHAEHIHANCRCEFAIRHDKKSGVQGYDPQKYLGMYNGDGIDDDIIEDIHDKYGYGSAETRRMAIRRQLDRQLKERNRDILKSFMGIPEGQSLTVRRIPRSVGDRVFQNSIVDFETDMEYHVGGDGRITNVHTFAGKGAKDKYRNAYKYANSIGGKPEEWKHMKGVAYIENEYESGLAEIHWSEHDEFGSFDPFVKKWL